MIRKYDRRPSTPSSVPRSKTHDFCLMIRSVNDWTKVRKREEPKNPKLFCQFQGLFGFEVWISQALTATYKIASSHNVEFTKFCSHDFRTKISWKQLFHNLEWRTYQQISFLLFQVKEEVSQVADMIRESLFKWKFIEDVFKLRKKVFVT